MVDGELASLPDESFCVFDDLHDRVDMMHVALCKSFLNTVQTSQRLSKKLLRKGQKSQRSKCLAFI